MDLRLDFLGCENLLDNAFLVDKIGGAENADGFAATRHLLAPTSQLLQQGGVGIGYEGELQAVGVGKLLLQSLLVLAHTNDLVACGGQLLLMGLQRTGFGGASAGVGLG